MTERNRFSVIVETENGVGREQAEEYIERMFAKLEKSEVIERGYIETDEIDETDAEQLLDMMGNLTDEEIMNAVDAIAEMHDE